MLHHFNQIGLLKKYLDESCYYKKYPLCEFKDKLTPQFLWHPESPFNLTGGWQKNAEEHNQIVRDLVTNHRYLSIYLKRAIESSFKQFFLFQSDPSYESRHPVDLTLKMIKNTYPYQKHQILDSLQNNGLLDLNRFDARQEMIICIAIIVFVFTIANQCFERNNFFFIYILFALFINAVICAFFSDPAQRYQNRVVFILSLPAFLAFIKSDLYGYFSKLLKVDD